MSKLLDIPLTAIRENQVALRGVNRTSEEFQQLVDSVRSEGILNPINVRQKAEGQGGKPDGKEYELIDGLHRFTAALEAGLTEIPAQVLDKTDAEALVAQVIGNIHKVETRPIEYTRGLLRILSNNPLMTEAELAAMLSVSPQFIQQRLSLTKLHPDVQKLVNAGEINLSNAFPLTKLPTEEQPNWIERAMTQGSGEFGPQVLERAKAINEAKRQGKQAGAEEFKPIPVMRKMSEIKDEFTNPMIGAALVRDQGITDPAAAFALGVAWTLQMDPVSQEGQKQRDAERKKKMEDEKAKRKAETLAKRSKEAQEKQAKLQQEAQAARDAAKARGIDVDAKPAEAEAIPV